MLLGFEVGRTLMQLTELAEITALAFAVEAEILKQFERVTGDSITKMLNGSFRCLQRSTDPVGSLEAVLRFTRTLTITDLRSGLAADR